MASSKLILALGTLKNDEWSSFKSYVHAHYRPDSDNAICFMAIYSRKDKLYEPDCEEKIKQKHFPKLSSKAFSNMLSRIFGHFELWLAKYSFSKEKYTTQLNLVKAYNERGLFKLANKKAQQLEQRIKSEQYLDLDQNSTLTQLYHAQYFSSNPIKKEKDSVLFDYCLRHFSYATKESSLVYLTELYNRFSIKNKKDDTAEEQLNKVIQSLPSTSFSRILEDGHTLIREGDIDSYRSVEATLKNEVLSPASNQYLILAIYLRRVTRLLVEKDLIPKESMLSIFEFMFRAMDKNRNEKFEAMQLYTSLEILAVFLRKEEVENLVAEWIDKVHTEDRAGVLAYCKVLIAFRNDNYEIIPDLLNGLTFVSPIYSIQNKILMIIAHYELGNEALAYNLIDNFRRLLKRTKENIAASHYPRIQNLMEIIVLLLKSKYDKTIEIDISKYSGIYFKSWVLKKLQKGNS